MPDKKIDLLILIGPTLSGKSYLVKQLENLYKPKINRMLQVTTRPMRVDESQGNDYFFIQDDYYSKLYILNLLIGSVKSGKTLEHSYGTFNHFHPDKINICILNEEGFESFMKENYNQEKYNLLLVTLLMDERLFNLTKLIENDFNKKDEERYKRNISEEIASIIRIREKYSYLNGVEINLENTTRYVDAKTLFTFHIEPFFNNIK
jgi:guanylate kinase